MHLRCFFSHHHHHQRAHFRQLQQQQNTKKKRIIQFLFILKNISIIFGSNSNLISHLQCIYNILNRFEIKNFSSRLTPKERKSTMFTSLYHGTKSKIHFKCNFRSSICLFGALWEVEKGKKTSKEVHMKHTKNVKSSTICVKTNFMHACVLSVYELAVSFFSSYLYFYDAI